MRMTVLKYEKKFNLGNYESETIGVELALDEEDNPNEVIEKAVKFVNLSKGKKV